MTRAWRSLLIFTIVLLSRPAIADPILIATGGFDALGGIQVSQMVLMSAQRGFLMVALPGNGIFDPGECHACPPGSQQSLAARWNGSDLPGQVTIDGTAYTIGLGAIGEGTALVDFQGTWTVPPFTGPLTAAVTRPFTFTGLFGYPPEQGRPNEDLVGQGRATLHLRWNASDAGWQFDHGTYAFTSEEAPVPEPASLLLVATGLGGVIARRMRGRRTHDTSSKARSERETG
jgi:hypothetical protein